MTDRFRIDSHKLMYHPDRLAQWRRDGDCYPIYVELSPSGACNHRCTFCGLDFVGYKPRFLDLGMLRQRLPEMGRLGIKSIMHGGEGEPLLHKDFPAIIRCGKESGIDQAITTNGVLLKPDKQEAILPFTSWIKVSINAGAPDAYAAIHRCPKEDFGKVLENIARASALKKQHGYDCAIGMQMILLPENFDTAVTLAQAARDAGADYLVIKPYSQHLQSETKIYQDINYEDALALEGQLAAFNTDSFSVVFRAETMRKWDEGSIPYSRCLALPFWSYVDAGGGVWGCSVFLGDSRFLYGDINTQTFEEIWQGEPRKQNLRMMRENWDTTNCRINCRMDKINRYLDDLATPPDHVNFI